MLKFRIQRKGHTTARAIELSLETPGTPTRAFSKSANLGAEVLVAPAPLGREWFKHSPVHVSVSIYILSPPDSCSPAFLCLFSVSRACFHLVPCPE